MNIYDAIENVCEKCGQHMSYPYWATNGYTCIKCGYTEKQKTHSEVEDEAFNEAITHSWNLPEVTK